MTQGRRQNVGAVRSGFAPWNDPTAVPLVRFRGVSKRFGETLAVDDVSLDIHEREFHALLGPSGCGKTTLMRMLAGFETPDAGTITLAGEDLTGIPPHRRPVNMMFQSYALFPHMSVADNVAFGLKMEGLKKPQIASRVEEMLTLVKLEALGKRMPHQLSGGQKQRVALARALAKKPKLLLLDEPLAALDRKLREETQFELTDLQMELGLTFLIVTHDQDEAMVLADRIAVMNQGRLVQTGAPAEVYEAPNSRYVAGFVGDINLFEGVAGASRLHGSDGDFEVHDQGGAGKGETVWLAVRPEKMTIGLDGPTAAAGNAVAGVVLDIGYLGDWTVYVVETAPGRVIRVAQANTARVVERPLTWGDKVQVCFAPDAGVVLTR